MSEEENANVDAEVVQPSETAEVQESVSKEPVKGSAEYNFRELRQKMEELQRQNQQLEMKLQYQPAPVKEADPVDELANLRDDDLMTAKQAKQLALRTYQELAAQQEQLQIEDKMRLRFKDYDDVVTNDNIKELIEDDRDFADALASSANPALAAYKAIKKAAFYQNKKTEKRVSPEAEKIVKNAAKPVSANTVQQRPLAGADSFARSSETERAALYREMQEYASRR
jgi:hypothetical protein